MYTELILSFLSLLLVTRINCFTKLYSTPFPSYLILYVKKILIDLLVNLHFNAIGIVLNYM